MSEQALSDQIFAFLNNYGHYVFLLVLVAIQLIAQKRPIPETKGSKVDSLNNLEELEKALKIAKKAKEKSGKEQYILVDFYASWCPPCRRAAPIYAEMSIKFHGSNFTFCKVDSEKAKPLAAHYGIKAYPTFKAFDSSGKEVFDLVGWKHITVNTFVVEHMVYEGQENQLKKANGKAE